MEWRTLTLAQYITLGHHLQNVCMIVAFIYISFIFIFLIYE